MRDPNLKLKSLKANYAEMVKYLAHKPAEKKALKKAANRARRAADKLAAKEAA